MVEGSPSVLLLPYFFTESFQSPDDYYLNRFYASGTRFLRYLAFFVALCMPGIYIALTTHHFAFIPLRFLIRLTSSRAGIPLPTSLELGLMIFFFYWLERQPCVFHRLSDPHSVSLQVWYLVKQQ